MAYNKNRTIPLFIEDGRRIGKEEKVRIEIRDQVHLRPVPEDIEDQRGCAGEEILDSRTIALCVQELLIASLKITQ